MPELAEVEYYRSRWDGGLGQLIQAVHVHPQASVFRETNAARLVASLTGTTLLSSAAAAKQMLFHFSGDHWLGVHLGMSGELTQQPANHETRRHDHLVLVQASQCLVFTDPRMFGRVRHDQGPTPPAWWTELPPALLSRAFTAAAVGAFLARHPRAPLKAVLLDQARFPGVGNWMADEILWRAALHPRRPAGSLTSDEVTTLHRECRWVAREALATIGRTFTDPPATWLFPHRWQDGGRCPRTGVPLVRESIGGRTTCWSPGRQSLP